MPFACEVCLRQFQTPEGLDSHMGHGCLAMMCEARRVKQKLEDTRRADQEVRAAAHRTTVRAKTFEENLRGCIAIQLANFRYRKLVPADTVDAFKDRMKEWLELTAESLEREVHRVLSSRLGADSTIVDGLTGDLNKTIRQHCNWFQGAPPSASPPRRACQHPWCPASTCIPASRYRASDREERARVPG